MLLPGALLHGLKNKPEFSNRGNTFKMETIRKKAKLFVQPKIHINNYRCFTTILHLMVYSMLQLNQTLETFNIMFKHTYTFCVLMYPHKLLKIYF